MQTNGHLSNNEIEDVIKKFELGGTRQKGELPILIIDDDKWIHRVLAHYLRSWGFQPQSAYDPIEGIAMAVMHKPMLILLDIIMPDINGQLLLKILKKIELTTNIPIIIISSNLSQEILGLTYKDGAVGFISKPVNQEVLYEKVQECLGPAVFKEVQMQSV